MISSSTEKGPGGERPWVKGTLGGKGANHVTGARWDVGKVGREAEL
jgi:hypothetical protein